MFISLAEWPTTINEIGNRFQNPFFLADFILTLITIAFVLVFVYRYIKAKAFKISITILFGLLLFTTIFGLQMGSIILCMIILALTVSTVILTGNEIRSVLRDEFHFSGIFNNKKNKVESISDNGLIDELTTAVLAMSHEKCGALITIEKEDRITTDHFSRWSDLNADVTNELLRTIFYKGTPLHDGATIIREGRIIRSGVIFDSVSVSNKAMPGSLGSRHRAALGITETYDCISITVSEETGSLHLYHNGKIEKCYANNFKEKLTELLKPEDEIENA